ncbi:hypothetical protein ACOMHN_012660 [Nucella lapillus]
MQQQQTDLHLGQESLPLTLVHPMTPRRLTLTLLMICGPDGSLCPRSPPTTTWTPPLPSSRRKEDKGSNSFPELSSSYLFLSPLMS